MDKVIRCRFYQKPNLSIWIYDHQTDRRHQQDCSAGQGSWALRSQFNNSIHHSMHLPILGISLGSCGGHLANSWYPQNWLISSTSAEMKRWRWLSVQRRILAAHNTWITNGQCPFIEDLPKSLPRYVRVLVLNDASVNQRMTSRCRNL